MQHTLGFLFRHTWSVKLSLVVYLLMLTAPVSAYAQATPPLCKAKLIEALKEQGWGSKKFIEHIEERKVDFQLTQPIEREIRNAGEYLGTDGLSKLIEAIRDNYSNPCQNRNSVRLISIPGQAYKPANDMKEKLNQQKCEVEVNPRTDPNENPKTSEIRFFHKSDESDAIRIAKFIECEMGINLVPKPYPQYAKTEPVGSLEIWLKE